MPISTIRVSPNWQIESTTRSSYVICPTRQFLSRYCTQVAQLRRYERQIVFVCSSNSSQSTKEYSVHFSRIICHGGPLLSHVKPYVEATPNYVVRVPIHDNPVAFRYVTDYVYAASVNISRLSVADCVQLALSCSKWKCVDFYVAILRFLVRCNRLITPRQFAVSTLLLWLPKERLFFAHHYFHNVQFVMKRMRLEHLIDLAFASHTANNGALCNRVLAHVVEGHPHLTETQLRRFLPLFQHMQVPSSMKRYMVRSIGRNSHAFSLKSNYRRARARDALQEAAVLKRTLSVMEDSLYPRYLALVDNEELFWNIVCRNGLADALIRFVMQRERDSLVQIVQTVARYVEPRMEEIETLAEVLSDISEIMTTRERDTLLRDMMRIDNWSKRATMLVASVFLYQTMESYETQIPVRLHWADVGRQPIMDLASACVDGIKFGVQVHSTFDRESSIVLICRGNDSGSLAKYARIQYVAWIVDTDCQCDSLRLLRRFSDGLLFAFDDERMNERLVAMTRIHECVTLLNVTDVRTWRHKHGKDCTAQMKIRIELERRQT